MFKEYNYIIFKDIKRRLKSSYMKLCQGFSFSNYLIWKLGLSDELEFWKAWLDTKGLQWPEGFSCRFDPHSKLQDYITELLDVPIGSEAKILDVGAGPLTYLGKCWEGRKVSIIAVDPLEAEYNKFLKQHHIIPPVRTTFARAEELLSAFPKNYFDLVYARNSIDHSYNPMVAIQQMIAVVKPDCFVRLYHLINEGENAQYQGLHQWNFFVDGGDFFISNHRKTVNVTQELNKIAEVSCKVKNNWVLSKIGKKL